MIFIVDGDIAEDIITDEKIVYDVTGGEAKNEAVDTEPQSETDNADGESKNEA